VSADIFSNLEAIRHFLQAEVADAVPPHLRSEVRAAAKLLGDIAAETDALPALLLAEGWAMLNLAEEAIAGLGAGLDGRTNTPALRRQLEQPMGSLRSLIGLHEALKLDTEVIFLHLQDALATTANPPEAMRALWDRYCAHLANQADARLPWQSVFPKEAE
jgi:hypothetical protein